MELERELFNNWFSQLMSQGTTCLLRDILRNQKENLWKEWQKVQPNNTVTRDDNGRVK